MKKLTALLLVLVMMLCIVACTPNEETNTNPSDSSSAPASNPDPDTDKETVMTFEQYQNAKEDDAILVECYVQATQSWYNDSIVVYAQDKTGGGYFAYGVACTQDEAAKLVPGTKIQISGYKTFYKGMPEIAAGATFTLVENGDSYIAEAEDLTSLLGSDKLVDKAGVLGAFKGLTIASVTYKNDAPGDDIYVAVTLGEKTYNFCVEVYLTGTDTDVYKAFADLKTGDKVDIEGFVYWYDGVNTHITSVKTAE